MARTRRHGAKRAQQQAEPLLHAQPDEPQQAETAPSSTRRSQRLIERAEIFYGRLDEAQGADG